ncbi:MAG: capsule assembly Wzi family protein [Treponema sp.]|nr:capsule assembly Wzi family protein [Treponema sp.]
MTADSHYGSKYAYFWYGSIDYPQRFGDSPFFTFDWGDTEIRYTWKTITIGFGTQSIWLGPAYLNPLLSSNNAGTYPKIDFGIRKTALYIPFAGWYLGDIEARMWLGYLTESDYFDNDPSNDHNLFNGLSLAYAPSFIKGFTIGFNKVCLSKWGKDSWKYLNPFYDTNDYEDQKASITTNFLLPKGNIELYSELAIDDYFQGGFIQGLSRYPFDSLSAVFGFKKSFSFYNLNKIKGEIIFEFCSCEEPWNKVSAKQKYAFNFHYQITQGYTNKGQAIGTSLGNGGNGQYFCFKLFFPKGESNFYLYRFNPDDTYMYFTENNENQYYKGELVLGTKIIYYVLPSISIGGGLGYDWIINPYYATSNISYINNFIFTFEVKYIL